MGANGVIAAEIAYEGEQETYSEIRVDGKRPANAPLSGDADYMRSFNNAWSTGDFENLAHCVFAGLEDSDFHKTGTEQSDVGDLAIYEFTGSRASTCVSVLSQSEIAYPSFRGAFKSEAADSRSDSHRTGGHGDAESVPIRPRGTFGGFRGGANRKRSVSFADHWILVRMLPEFVFMFLESCGFSRFPAFHFRFSAAVWFDELTACLRVRLGIATAGYQASTCRIW